MDKDVEVLPLVQGMEMQIILASASPRRRELLSQVGMDYRVMPSTVEEKITRVRPEEVVQELSCQKAADVCGCLMKQGEDGFVVIGADTVVALGDRIMGKPGSVGEACNMLAALQGKVHQVYTGVTLCIRQEGEKEVLHTFYEKTDVSMFPMTEEEIRAYVSTGEPMDKAGAYAIQGRCAAYIRSICGDYNNVVGLPVGRLYQELKGLVQRIINN